MTSLWMPGATVIPGTAGGSMLGGPRKCIWHTTENDPTKVSAADIAHYLQTSRNTVHLVWNPWFDQIVQMLPANVGGRGLENREGGVETNRGGALVVQIEVVGRASQPFTNGPMRGLPRLQTWLAGLGIPPVWAGALNRSTANWGRSGHFGHSEVPENSHWDPGAIDRSKLISRSATTEDDVEMISKEAQDFIEGRFKAYTNWTTDYVERREKAYSLWVAKDIKDALGKLEDTVSRDLVELGTKLDTLIAKQP